MNDALRDCLIVVDVQKDFCPGGALGVPMGDEVVSILNRWIERFRKNGMPVVYSQDWHPQDHCSFKTQGGVWPPHCVADTSGAGFHEDLVVEGSLIRKGANREKEAYSAFDGRYEGELHEGQISVPCIFKSRETLAEHLKRLGVGRLFVGGLATDYCVKETVLDGLKRDFTVFLINEGSRAVNVNPKDGEEAVAHMVSRGAHLAGFQDLQFS